MGVVRAEVGGLGFLGQDPRVYLAAGIDSQVPPRRPFRPARVPMVAAAATKDSDVARAACRAGPREGRRTIRVARRRFLMRACGGVGGGGGGGGGSSCAGSGSRRAR